MVGNIGLVFSSLWLAIKMVDGENYLRGHQERAKVDWRRSALDRGHSRRLASKCLFVEGGDVKGGEVVMAEISRGDKLLISADQREVCA